MNPIAEEILSYLGSAESGEHELAHYGIKRRSGRYPWGSGDDPYQHGSDFLGRVEELRKQNFTYTDPDTGKKYSGDTAIAKSLGLSTGQFRTEIGLAKDERRMLQVATVKSLQKDGLNNSEIGRKMGINESTVRSLLDSKSEAKMNQAKETAALIKKHVDEKGMIDVGKGVERELGISKEKMDQALYLLEKEGYKVYGGRAEQQTNKGNFTTIKVICPPGTEHKDIYNFDQIHSIKEYISRDGGETFEKKFYYPASLDSKRLKIRYSEDGGLEKDGIIELRRNVPDLSLGESKYSQVRILVDGTHYLKGMAVYSDNMPDGVDVIFNTNKTKDKAMGDVLKKIKDDPENPFGSTIKDAEQGGQYWYDAKTGKRCSANDPNVKDKKLGLINKRADEGDWTEWSDSLPSQFLAKQNINMAKKQLKLAIDDKQYEFNEIKSINNPTIKKHFLEKFADECDAAAVHLKAAALPGQKYHVIIPINTLKDNEVYAPGYEHGTKLALIRYPHGGTFEIPILTVNNKNQLANKIIGKESIDAIGINKNIADRLSGADFDGDTVMAIPTHDKQGKVHITSKPPLKGLEGFEPKTEYPERPGMRYMKNTQTEMGMISNLITDMTLKGATDDELAAAVRHSMVVIDAEKHKLDYKQSEIDNNIKALKKRYQGRYDENGRYHEGASTLISRAKGQATVDKRQGSPYINIKGSKNYDPNRPEGSLIFKTADDLEYQVTRTNKRTGEVETVTKKRTQKSTNMAETDDARTLISEANTAMERVYADFANRMKSMANEARKEYVATGKLQYDKNAKAIYQEEVSSLMAKLNTAKLNAPKERLAQLKANAEVNRKRKDNPNMTAEEIKKAGQQAVNKYRAELGSVARKKREIDITDREWEAIQAGAISDNKLKEILNNSNVDSLRQRATPRATKEVTVAKANRIKSLSNSGYTLAEIANKLGISTSTVSNYLKGAN